MSKVTEKLQTLLLRTWTPNQVVAHNVVRARALRGWTQEQAADQLAPYLGSRLSHASFSAMERSVATTRVKQFSADDLVALCRAFRLPLGWWFTPPPDGTMHTPDHSLHGVDFAELVDLVLGTPETQPAWADALNGWTTRRAGTAPSVEHGPTVASRASELAELQARALVRERFGDIGQARDVLRRLADLLDQMDREIGNATTDTGRRQPRGAKKRW